jgi:PBP1b-binding outer membrane lipoprotein LpoB
VIKVLLSIMITSVFFSGCSSNVLMPYEENPTCKLKPGQGQCGSVSEIYERSEKMGGYIKNI